MAYYDHWSVDVRRDSNARLLRRGGQKLGPWSPEEDAIAARLDITLTEMAYMTGRPYGRVVARRKKLRKRGLIP